MKFKQHKHNQQHSLILLILGYLRYLGRVCCFDDIEEATGISQEVHLFFREFTKFGNSYLYICFVKYLTNSIEDQTHMVEFKTSAMNGEGGLMDACHVTMKKYSYRLKQNHLKGV